VIEPPEDMIPAALIALRPTRWVFSQSTPESLDRLWVEAGLSDRQRAALSDSARREVQNGTIVLHPSPELVSELPPAARARIYAALATNPQNLFQHDPYRIRTENAPEWFDGSGLPADVIALARRLMFTRGPSTVFADPEIVLPRLATPAQRTRFIKTISRKASQMIYLRVDPQSDVNALTRYWAGGRRKDLAPILDSLAARPGGGVIDIVHLLPPFARLLLYTYPVPSLDERATVRDCHWSSFNFFQPQVDDRFIDIGYVKQVLLSDFYPAGGAPTFGDLVMLVGAGDRVVHSCVYIADDIVFTKNGAAFSVPWLLTPLDAVVSFYSLHEPLEVRRYRAKSR
jgi:hypothetical protein